MALSMASRWVAITATLLFLLTAPAMAHPTLDIVASNWKFAPSKMQLRVGETTVLHITSSEGVHGIASEELGIPNTTIMPNKFVDVPVTPKKAGTYKVHCSIQCGAGHADMVLTVEVLP